MKLVHRYAAAVALLALAACSDRSAPPSAVPSAVTAATSQVEADMRLAPAWTFGAPAAARETAPRPAESPARTSPDDVNARRLAAILVTSDDLRSLPETAPAAAAMPAGRDEQSLERTARWWSAGAVYRWHEIARELTARHHLNSSYSSRLFAALAVAQHDAALALLQRLPNPAPAALNAAIAYSSVTVLGEIFPDQRRFLAQNALAHVASSTGFDAVSAREVGTGQEIGERVGGAVVARLRNDGAAGAREPRVQQQPGKWYSKHQTLPGWSRVRPWVMDSADQFRAPPPPPVDSSEFRLALDEIRRYSAGRSAEHLAIATHWDLGVGGISVPGMWGARALQDSRAAGWSELRTARLMAVLHMAMFDACIASWETKYHYLVPRPSMLAPDIDEPLGLPPHPSYTSGHSAFSGAAEAVLSAAFPERAPEFSALAEEASASRFFGGIHYRFDGDQGLIQGRKAGALVLERHPLL